MFKTGDKVINIRDLERGIGTVQAEYLQRYLVSWPREGPGQATSEGEKDLLLASSPLAVQLEDIRVETDNLQEQKDALVKQREQILKGMGR